MESDKLTEEQVSCMLHSRGMLLYLSLHQIRIINSSFPSSLSSPTATLHHFPPKFLLLSSYTIFSFSLSLLHHPSCKCIYLIYFSFSLLSKHPPTTLNFIYLDWLNASIVQSIHIYRYTVLCVSFTSLINLFIEE